jgi:hypothetical protein
VSDIDTGVVDSLKALDPEWPIREADIKEIRQRGTPNTRLCARSISLAFSNFRF